MWTYLFLRIIKADKMGQFQSEANRQLPHKIRCVKNLGVFTYTNESTFIAFITFVTFIALVFVFVLTI